MRVFVSFWLVLVGRVLVDALTKVVVPAILGDSSAIRPWMSKSSQEKYGYSVFMYQNSNPEFPNYLNSFHGTEGGIHLRYVVEHYDDFPDIAVFVGSNPESRQSRWPQMLSCIHPNASYISISNEHVCRDTETWRRYSIWIEQCWRDVLSVAWNGTAAVDERVPRNRVVQSCAQCCQQFIVSRAKIHSRPLEVWTKLLNMIAIENVCHKDDPEYDRLNAFRLNRNMVGPEKNSYTGSNINNNGKLIQGGAMEHLSHVVFGDLALKSTPPTNYDWCNNFLSDDVCPSSPCQFGVPREPPPPPPPREPLLTSAVDAKAGSSVAVANNPRNPFTRANLRQSGAGAVAAASDSQQRPSHQQQQQKQKQKQKPDLIPDIKPGQFNTIDPDLVPFNHTLRKVIVPSVYKEWEKERPDWATEEMQKKFNYSIHLYQKTNSSAPHFMSTNRGTEAGVYLRYIVDHYDSFPDVAIFVHAEPHKHAPNWMNYVNCVRPTTTYFNFNEERVQRDSMAWKHHALWVEQCWRDVLKVAWGFGNGKYGNDEFMTKVPNTRPITVVMQCCQQFTMSRQMVHARPLSVWKTLLKMIGVEETCHSGDLDYKSLFAARANQGVRVPLENTVNGNENNHGQLIQGGTMEHLAHVVYGQLPLRTEEYDMLEVCNHFEDEGRCPGSPCKERLIVTRSPTVAPTTPTLQPTNTPAPSTAPSTAPTAAPSYSMQPTNTADPSLSPSQTPTHLPSLVPTEAPFTVSDLRNEILSLRRTVTSLTQELTESKEREAQLRKQANGNIRPDRSKAAQSETTSRTSARGEVDRTIKREVIADRQQMQQQQQRQQQKNVDTQTNTRGVMGVTSGNGGNVDRTNKREVIADRQQMQQMHQQKQQSQQPQQQQIVDTPNQSGRQAPYGSTENPFIRASNGLSQSKNNEGTGRTVVDSRRPKNSAGAGHHRAPAGRKREG